jgi:hypothetical protein
MTCSSHAEVELLEDLRGTCRRRQAARLQRTLRALLGRLARATRTQHLPAHAVVIAKPSPRCPNATIAPCIDSTMRAWCEIRTPAGHDFHTPYDAGAPSSAAARTEAMEPWTRNFISYWKGPE